MPTYVVVKTEITTSTYTVDAETEAKAIANVKVGINTLEGVTLTEAPVYKVAEIKKREGK